jgi:starch-binding outer membrane protein, SusD/RagB family
VSSTRKAWRPLGAFLGACAAIAACSSILDVENPNNVPEEALDNPASATAQAAGVLAATVRGLAAITTPYSVATDELDWIGSRDAWRELETGAIDNHFNEFTDQAFPFIAEARFLGDQAIANLLRFDTDPAFSASRPPRFLLARAYLYTAIVYASIADMYDDYAFSSKADARLPIGRANMGRLYDTAIVYLDRANVIANSSTAADFTALRYPIMAYRARAKHGKAVWQSITPQLAAGVNRTVTLINDAGANADAAAALTLSGSPDAAYTLIAPNTTTTIIIHVFFEVNGRNEHRTGIDYRTLNDPVTGALDARAQTVLSQFSTSGGPPPAPPGAPTQAGTFTITSNREMRLILAEAALAAGNNAEAQNQINAIRALDAGRTAWDGVTPAPLAMLQHERRVQLWLMRRRLADMHRFNLKDSRWVPGAGGVESAFNINGLLFPIPQVERLGNPCVSDSPPAGCQP